MIVRYRVKVLDRRTKDILCKGKWLKMEAESFDPDALKRIQKDFIVYAEIKKTDRSK